MCRNIMDGRYFSTCGHFTSMATRLQDCFSPTCVFSGRHPLGCKDRRCCNMMTPPAQNPIRISPGKCAACLETPIFGMQKI
ncbi:hypothetical protein CONPUDRAFT_98043 [Coniophora puteana RWD-64-598 SS2]|uniref:Uncharacterized protein n=1 Tax=Coniophora puteana (strain RWD-64-598) TaxID=741705 RepID=A0A5M3N1F2_CONPW|nr:uncharacterized protein CONPUDRAFT_98043 [Coniophora puteana RWD-64-598 SS2]EIW85208.1 hypothetical protein CONPUDRAFT_98043 [Coniophora puteana RWD-64-598 SS2]